ncbi:MAG: hypothetical protein AAGN15_19435 [Cyanobacteria bacterium J06581_3]
MKFKQSLLILVWSVVGLCGIAPFLWGAFCLLIFTLAANESTLTAEQTYNAGKYVVHEKIYQEGSGWPDYDMRRHYEVSYNGTHLLGEYENESRQGIFADTPPKIVGDWLVVLSSNHVYLWRPDREPIVFFPYAAENWNVVFSGTVSMPNGHYDYAAEQFLIDEERWLLTYRCIAAACGDQSLFFWPETMTFYSDDEGEHFYLIPPEDVSLEAS